MFRSIKQFENQARQASRVCGVEMALWDLAGKASNVPAYQRLGGKVRCYADTDGSPGPKIFVGRLKERMDRGYTYLKMNLGVQLV